MTVEKELWQPIRYDERWTDVNTEKFDNILPSWYRRREELQENPQQYEDFINRIKRKQAIDTGILERMYDLKRGVTETFIEEGFVDSFLQYGDTNISSNLLMDFLNDNYNAIDFIFDFVKNDRSLSTGFIKELHHLVTQHQDSTEAIDQFGNRVDIPLQKGEYKTRPNNPQRGEEVFVYCPPEQVASEMDQMLLIFEQYSDIHVLARAAFLHHAFVQIHPFQDGNGRLARLLASFVLIKEGLFPLSIDREDRAKYIEALENADRGEYQHLVDVFSESQIGSIELALNLNTSESNIGYDNVLSKLSGKISNYREEKAERKRAEIKAHMEQVFEIVRVKMCDYERDMLGRLPEVEIKTTFCSPSEEYYYYYAHQIVEYARKYQYYANLSLDRAWGRMYFKIDEQKQYRMVISVHHYGYDGGTLAIGGILSKIIARDENEQNEYTDIPISVPPLITSVEKDVADLEESIREQVQLTVMATLAYIVNEL